MVMDSPTVTEEPPEVPDRSCPVVVNLTNGSVARVNRLARAYAQRAKLSLRETEVFTLFVSNGKSNKEIAADLGVAYPTVKLYWTRIYKKARVRQRRKGIGGFPSRVDEPLCVRAL